MMRLEYEYNGPRVLGVHVRYRYVNDHPTDTVVELFNNAEDDKLCAAGVAFLHTADTFSRPRGRKLAFERAVERYTFDKAHRAAIWKAFLSKVKVR